MILQGKTVKTAHVEGDPRGPSWCSEADSSESHISTCPNIGGMGSNHLFSSPHLVDDTIHVPDFDVFLTGKKLSDCILETWDLLQKMPVKYEKQD